MALINYMGNAVKPKQYVGLNLTEFLKVVLTPYPDVLAAIKLLTDGQSPEYDTFHELSTKEHVGIFQIRQRGLTYQLNRKSCIRGTAGYERYVYLLNENNPLWSDDVNVACRYFRSQWDPWFTIKLNA